MALKSSEVAAIKPEERELARKVLEQTTLETELTERELRTANLRAELGAFENDRAAAFGTLRCGMQRDALFSDTRRVA